MKKALRVLMLIWALVPLSNQTLKGMTNIEEWKDIPGYEGIYAASSQGRIKSKARIVQNGLNKCFKGDKYLYLNLCKKNGYIKVYLQENKIKKYTTAHQLVAQAFIPNPENKPYVNHINGIKADNRVENLEWVTAKENFHHAVRIGLAGSNIGCENPRAILSEVDVIMIREMAKKTRGKRQEIASKFGVSKRAIDKIMSKTTWKHL